jgi:predicted MPP superfamily phosphohydrolase
MSRLLDLELFLALAGHFSIVVWLFNRMHALGWHHATVKKLELALFLFAFVIIGLFCTGRFSSPLDYFTASKKPVDPITIVLCLYVALCWLALLLSIPLWLIPKLGEHTAQALVSNDTTLLDVPSRLGYSPVHGRAAWMASFPGNQLLQITVQKKTLQLPTLPVALDGLTIAHLSDLHMTGQLGVEFYDCIVDETNALAPDVVVITGDILEKEQCLPWIAKTLGRLQARYGKFFILGNHETRLPDIAPLRAALVASGFTDLGGRCLQFTINGTPITLAGTELPWLGAAPPAPEADPETNTRFRLLLSHSPDQLPWARQHGFHLMLAGHNHGGQIRLPYLGALVTPSLYGSRYAGGLYFSKPTLLHVSRGLAGVHPIRLNCPPELPLLILKSA